MTTFNPSKYQEAVFEFTQAQVARMQGKEQLYENIIESLRKKDFIQTIPDNPHNGVIISVAGSGKTKTGKELVKYIPRNMRVLYLAFNKHIATELKRELPPNSRAMTNHALGFSSVGFAMRQVGKKPNVDSRKVIDMVKNIFMTEEKYMKMTQEEVDAMTPIIVRVVSLLKGTLMPVNKKSVEYLIDRYGIDNNVDHDILTEIVARVMLNSKRVTEASHPSSDIDFDDMVWLPVVLNLPLLQYDFVIIDEAQDLNASQLQLAMKAVKKNGTIIAIGDPKQSIYGFAGADVNSIPNIISKLNPAILPLSISYRCPVSHIRLAQEIVPEIESPEWAETGEIVKMKEDKITEYAETGDLIICRYNAPLVKPCFDLIRHGKKAMIKGRDIGKGLISIVRRIKGTSMKEFLYNLEKWKKREKEKCELRGKSPDSIIDKYETLVVLSEDCDNTNELIRKIEKIFSDDKAAIQLSSIHKAKGLEADNVFILKPFLMPSPYAKAEWEMEQEKNLKYVALTRAKKTLIFVGN